MTDFFDHYFANTGMPERAEQTAWQRAEHAELARPGDPKRAEFALSAPGQVPRRTGRGARVRARSHF